MNNIITTHKENNLTAYVWVPSEKVKFGIAFDKIPHDPVRAFKNNYYVIRGIMRDYGFSEEKAARYFCRIMGGDYKDEFPDAKENVTGYPYLYNRTRGDEEFAFEVVKGEKD